MSAYDDLSERARWFLENFSELDLAAICADQEAHLKANTATLNAMAELGRSDYDCGNHDRRIGYLTAMGRVTQAIADGHSAPEEQS